MSGAEASLVVGLISGVIAIIDSIKKIYDAAQDAQGQPEAFRKVASRLPIVLSILQKAKADARELDEDAQDELEPTIAACREKAEKLQKIFKKVARKDDASWFDRYKTIVGTLGKGSKVEVLMEGILKDIQVLAFHKLMEAATGDQVRELGDAIKEMSEIQSSIPDESGSLNQTHYGSGHNIANTGSGTQGNNMGSGSMYQNDLRGGTANFADIHNTYNFSEKHLDEEKRQCFYDLKLTDPRDDRSRIEDEKDDLLTDCYAWILENPGFINWWDCDDTQLLWIKGDPGKGKTMLMMGLVRELELPFRANNDPYILSYFFCRATEPNLKSAVSVLRGLIYLLAVKQESLIKHVQKRHKTAGASLFTGSNTFYALSSILLDMLQDPGAPKIYLMVDALDECEIGLPELLKFISRSTLESSKVKWLLSSRNRRDIEESLPSDDVQLKISLELNKASIDLAVKAFIDVKVSKLKEKKKYSSETYEKVKVVIYDKADGTFLWVGLVCKELEQVASRKTLSTLQRIPADLHGLYNRMMNQVWSQRDYDDVKICQRILASVTLAARPLHLIELCSLVGLEEISNDIQFLKEWVDDCGSFLTIRNEVVSFVHQSAKDYFDTVDGSKIFLEGKEKEHSRIVHISLTQMCRTLKKNICCFDTPGPLKESQYTNPIINQKLLPIKYACSYWVEHLSQFKGLEEYRTLLEDNGKLHQFFLAHFLHWFEAMGLLRLTSRSILMIRILESIVEADKSPSLYAFVYDAKQFALYNRSVVEQAPLQLYCSALVFAPEKSVIRANFEKYAPVWVQAKLKLQANWNSALQTLEGHSNVVNSVAFSPDGKQVISGSYDETVRLWDAMTGAVLQILQGHSDGVNSVAFSPDGKQVVSGSSDKTVRIWDVLTGVLLQTLEGYSGPVSSVVFSSDGKQVISGSEDKIIVWSWDIESGASLQTLRDHSKMVESLAFSPDGKQAVSRSSDKVLQLWDVVTGLVLQTLEGQSRQISSMAFSYDGKQVVSGSSDNIVRIWDVLTGGLLQIFEGHSNWISSVSFSPDGKQVVSGSYDKTVRLWDTITGVVLQTFEGYSVSVAFSPNGKQVVSGSSDNIVRIWDIVTGVALQTFEGYSNWVASVSFSPDGKQIVSGSEGGTVQLWDALTGEALQIFEGHSSWVCSVSFSPDGKQVVSGSSDKTVRIWDVLTGVVLQTFEGHYNAVHSVAFSPNGKQVVSGSSDNIVRIWDVLTGGSLQTFEGHSNWVNSVSFSPDGKQVVSGSSDKTVRLWDTITGVVLQTFKGHSNWVCSVAFSPDGKQVVSGSSDNIVWVWDIVTGVALQTLVGYLNSVQSVAFLSDGKVEQGLFSSDNWIISGKEKILWLPPEYRTESTDVWKRSIVLGHSSESLSIFEFKEESKYI